MWAIPTLDIHDSAWGAALPPHECGWLCQVLCPFQEYQLSEWLPLLQPKGKYWFGSVAVGVCAAHSYIYLIEHVSIQALGGGVF